jgi:hypothetical protein
VSRFVTSFVGRIVAVHDVEHGSVIVPLSLVARYPEFYIHAENKYQIIYTSDNRTSFSGEIAVDTESAQQDGVFGQNQKRKRLTPSPPRYPKFCFCRVLLNRLHS